MFELVSISYEESRLEYFRAQKARCERCLDYWLNALRKGKRGYSQIMLHDKCSEYGEMINYYDDAIRAFEDAPVVDAEPVRHGMWVEKGMSRNMLSVWECSECNLKFDGKTWNYCPNCGARMDAEVNT